MQIGVFTEQFALRHADGRQIGDHAEMGGDAEAAWMGDALAIDQTQIGAVRQTFERGQDRGQLAKGQQARDVGHYGGQPGEMAGQWLQAVGVKQHGGGTGDRTILLEADIEAGHGAQWRVKTIAQTDAFGECGLLIARGVHIAMPARSGNCEV